eukprot:jgi/Hompol1/408/HPOL_005303-RA
MLAGLLADEFVDLLCSFVWAKPENNGNGRKPDSNAESYEVQLVTGAVRRLYEMEGGTLVRGLDDLKDNAQYVATGGEPLRRIVYSSNEELGQPFTLSSKNPILPKLGEQRQRRKINRSTGGLLMQDPEIDHPPAEQPLFGPTSKAYKILVFENGEPSDPGVRMILNYRNCKTFEQFLRHLSSLLVLKTGQVRKLYDAESGKRIRTLHDIHPGQNLVAASFEHFKRVPYPIQNLAAPVAVVKRDNENPRIVTFYPNGDSYHTGLTVTVIKKRFPTLARLLDTLNHQIELVTGKIQKIYSMEGTRVNTIDDFEMGKGPGAGASDRGGDGGGHEQSKSRAASSKTRAASSKSRAVSSKPRTAKSATKSATKRAHTAKGDEQAKVAIQTEPLKDSSSKTDHTVPGTPDSRPRTKSRQQSRQGVEVAPTETNDIPEDENIRGAQGGDEVYEQRELKKLEGKAKSVKIAATSKDDLVVELDKTEDTLKSTTKVAAAAASTPKLEESKSSSKLNKSAPKSPTSPKSPQSPKSLKLEAKSKSLRSKDALSKSRGPSTNSLPKLPAGDAEAAS